MTGCFLITYFSMVKVDTFIEASKQQQVKFSVSEIWTDLVSRQETVNILAILGSLSPVRLTGSGIHTKAHGL